MCVDVDEAWHHEEAGDVDGLFGLFLGDVPGDVGDFAVGDRDVAYLVDVVLRIDDVAVLEEQFVPHGILQRVVGLTDVAVSFIQRSGAQGGRSGRLSLALSTAGVVCPTK